MTDSFIDYRPCYRSAVEGECFYCGAPADTDDHVIPRVRRRRLEAVLSPAEWAQLEHALPDTVPACGDCNRRKGSATFKSVADICAYLHDSLERRHRQMLLAPDWAEDELEAIEGRPLREDIERRNAHVREIRRRLGVLRRHAGPRSAVHS